uniref:Chorismate lyase n=1 Tax=Acrochaetium secundatum TaxID=209631 RepID=A0A4D6BKJ6_9FLOR|nr:hypothetical protein [Acrochaetium secundatum]QBX88512.1 hypothetical protein [Acrochaetium secundatum]
MMIDIEPNFIKMWNYQVENNPHSYIDLNLLLPPKLHMLMTSDGSLTRHNAILNSENITLEIINEFYSIGQETLIAVNQTYTKRSIWLVSNKDKKIFAQSYWQIIPQEKSFLNLNKPIGKALIQTEINMHRNLFSIYFGYCNDIEKQFNHNGPLWGRSYKITPGCLSPIFIHEVFSPSLIKTIQ